MNALVTGAAGLIGTNLCRELLAHGDTVRAVIRPGGRSPDAAPLEIVEADVRERGALVEAARGCDVLFHTAATFAYWGVPEAELFRTAVEGARNAVEAAHEAGVARLVLTSSSVTCGSSLRLAPRDERDQLGADEVCPAYFRAKAEAERSAVERAHELDVDLVLALPTITVGGPDDKPVPSNAHLLDYLADPYHLTFPGGCNIVGVRDVAAGHRILAASGQRGERYLLGAENWEWSMIHRTLSELTGLPGPGQQVGHTGATLLASGWELAATLSERFGRPLTPPTTREQARTLGRYYFYRSDRARALGWTPSGSRAALAEAVGWLVSSRHVTPALRRQMRLDPEVWAARRASGWTPIEEPRV